MILLGYEIPEIGGSCERYQRCSPGCHRLYRPFPNGFQIHPSKRANEANPLDYCANPLSNRWHPHLRVSRHQPKATRQTAAKRTRQPRERCRLGIRSAAPSFTDVETVNAAHIAMSKQQNPWAIINRVTNSARDSAWPLYPISPKAPAEREFSLALTRSKFCSDISSPSHEHFRAPSPSTCRPSIPPTSMALIWRWGGRQRGESDSHLSILPPRLLLGDSVQGSM